MKNTPEKVKNYFQSLPIWAQVLALAEAVVVLVGLVVLLVATASNWWPPIAATVFVIWMIYGKLREAKESNAVKSQIINDRDRELCIKFLMMALSPRRLLVNHLSVEPLGSLDERELLLESEIEHRNEVPVFVFRIPIFDQQVFFDLDLDRRTRIGLQKQVARFLTERKIAPKKWGNLDVITVTKCEVDGGILTLEIVKINNDYDYKYARAELESLIAYEAHHAEPQDVDFR